MDLSLMHDCVYGDDEVAEGGGALLKAMDIQYKMKIESGGRRCSAKHFEVLSTPSIAER
jgi:hypothetical protein